MKCILLILIIILFALASCGHDNTSTNEFITVDVTSSYPKKVLILQDFMDVEYIPLETSDDFLCQGYVQAIGKDIIIVKNFKNDGNIYIFDRQGKALRKINRKGQGGEEYTNILKIVLDEENGEMFVNDMYAKKIHVYDLEGNFKRSLPHKDEYLFFEMYNFDKDNLICHDAYNENTTSLSLLNTEESFMMISKQDGSITKKIHIPFKEKKSIIIKHKDEASGMTYSYMPSAVYPIIPYFDNYILVEPSADTVYTYSPDHTMKPFLIRTPSIQSMTQEIFLLPSVLTDRYYFMGTVKKDVSFSRGNVQFDGDNLVYDREEKAIFRYIVYNDDYSCKEEVYMQSFPGNNEIASIVFLEAPKLVKYYEEGKLKGQLKEIAAELNEESNPVIMLLKHKK